MGECVPNHIACEWHEPDFVSGSEGCSLTTFNESKARLLIGGTFFRSIGIGSNQNNISVESVWQVDDGGLRDYNGATDLETDVVEVLVTIRINGIVQAPSPYHVPQVGVTVTGGSPEFNYTNWTTSAIDGLRTLLSSSIILNMPDIDLKVDGAGSPNTWNRFVDEGSHLTEFSASLSGGSGGPADGTQDFTDIRTGPIYNLVFIVESEVNTDDGSVDDVNELRFWNGNCWKPFDSNAPECSLPTTIPGSAVCLAGPESEC